MPGLVKVGYTLKDPDLRAKELNHTGSPFPYIVEYDVLVHEPRDIEQAVHAFLVEFKEGKEWFRCSINDAISAIESVGGASLLFEKFKKPKGTVSYNELMAGLKLKRARYMVINCAKCGNKFEANITGKGGCINCPVCLSANNVQN